VGSSTPSCFARSSSVSVSRLSCVGCGLAPVRADARSRLSRHDVRDRRDERRSHAPVLVLPPSSTAAANTPSAPSAPRALEGASIRFPRSGKHDHVHEVSGVSLCMHSQRSIPSGDRVLTPMPAGPHHSSTPRSSRRPTTFPPSRPTIPSHSFRLARSSVEARPASSPTN
jgi:hypothetical protein